MRGRERQRDRETERQRDRETERKRERDRERYCVCECVFFFFYLTPYTHKHKHTHTHTIAAMLQAGRPRRSRRLHRASKPSSRSPTTATSLRYVVPVLCISFFLNEVRLIELFIFTLHFFLKKKNCDCDTVVLISRISITLPLAPSSIFAHSSRRRSGSSLPVLPWACPLPTSPPSALLESARWVASRGLT